jgi:hypothetical protein
MRKNYKMNAYSAKRSYILYPKYIILNEEYWLKQRLLIKNFTRVVIPKKDLVQFNW